MRKVSFLIAICLILAVMIATIAAQGPPAGAGGGQGGGGGRGGGGRGAPPVMPTAKAGTGANGAADLSGPTGIMAWLNYENGTMRGQLTANDAKGVAESLATMQTLFASAQTAFNKEKVKGAADLAKAAADAAGTAQGLAKSGTADAASTKAVTDSCGGCHTTYRQKDASGAYSIKAQ